MANREKVINGLDCCINHGKEIPRLGTFVCDFKNCTYEHYAGTSCYRILIKDALELLKAQEPVSPTIKQEMDDICSCIDNVAYCGRCGVRIGRLKQNYCSECGQAVKWE